MGIAEHDFLFDQYLRAHRNAEDLIKRGESETLEFKSTLRWSLKEDKQDDKLVTHAVLKTGAAFLNTEGGDLLIGVADDGSIVGIEKDQLETDAKFMRHLAQVVRNGPGTVKLPPESARRYILTRFPQGKDGGAQPKKGSVQATQ